MPRLIDDSIGGIGASATAYLTEAQFQGLFGTGWILQDGRSVVGSRYAALTGATNAPDARGRVIRGKDNSASVNPDGELALGQVQGDAFGSHTHVQNAHNHTQDPHVHNAAGETAARGTGPNTGWGIAAGQTNGAAGVQSATATNQAATATNQSSGGNETRMKNVTANHFIRIN